MIDLIAACGHNRIIGKQGKLPWSIKEDWEYFLATTRGGILIMGRHCYEEFEQFAPEREVIALTRNPEQKFPHAQKSNSLGEALEICRAKKKTAWICGGREIYEESFPLADKLYLTLIDAPFSGDVFFPPWKDTFVREISKKKLPTKNYLLTFLVLGK